LWRGAWDRGGIFFSGKVAMSPVASPEIQMGFKPETPFKWTTIQMPRQKNPGSHFYSHGFFITQGSKNKEAAAEFVRLSALPEQLARWNTLALGMPTTKAALAHKTWTDFISKEPRLKAYSDSTAYMRCYPLISRWNEASVGNDGIGQALMDIVQGKIAVKAGLEESARKAAAFLGVQMA
jgi:ABC-type glycerol-3-phosphate transport system substrate-binding protein